MATADRKSLRNSRLTVKEFEEQRSRVTSQHPNGANVVLEEGIEFHKTHMSDRNVVKALQRAKKDGVTPMNQVYLGRATQKQHYEALEAIQEADVDILTTSIDSFTRTHDWEKVEEELKTSRETGRSELNGYPIVHHGVGDTRELVAKLGKPIQVRATAPDLRLATEIGFASGHSAFCNNPLWSLANYTKEVPLHEIIHNYQYIFRLMAYYEEHGVPMIQDITSIHAGYPVPPSLEVATIILDVLIAAEQGMKHLTMVPRAQGNIGQLAAAYRVLDELSDEYLAQFGHDDVTTYRKTMHWMGVWPENEPQGYALMNLNTVESVLAGADWEIIKTPVEGVGLPYKEDSVNAVRSTNMVRRILKGQGPNILDDELIATETDVIEQGARAIVDKVIELGDGDVVQGELNAVESGVIDVPFPSSKELQGNVLTARDAQNAIRYFEPGALPIPSTVMEYHEAKLDDRSEQEGIELNYDTIVDDIRAFK